MARVPGLCPLDLMAGSTSLPSCRRTEGRFVPMKESPDNPEKNADERRARVIAELLEKATASPDPVGWVRDFTLKALRAPNSGALPTSDRADARREIHAIGREVSGALRRRLPANEGEPAKELSDGPSSSEPPI